MFRLIAALGVILGACAEQQAAWAAQAAHVARVAAASKGVTVLRANGKVEPATPNLMLVESDLLKIPVAAILLVEVLANHQVVRLDEDLELEVRDLALLHAPPAALSLTRQLDNLVSASEKVQLNERTTGWSVTIAAVAVSGITVDEEAASARKGEPAIPAQQGKKKDDLVDRRAKVAGTSVTPAAGVEADKPAPPAKVASTPPPKPPAPVDAELTSCLQDQVHSLGAAVAGQLGPTLLVRYRLSGGRLRVQLEGGLPIPACAATWFTAHQGGLSAGDVWRSFEVPLK